MQRLFKTAPLVCAAVLALLVGGKPAAAQTTVFFSDFNGGAPPELSGSFTLEGVQGFAGLGPSGNQFSGNFLRNASLGNPAAASVLTLTGLQAHTSVDVDFLLAAIDSWDSSNGVATPDFFNVTVDGVSVFQDTFATASGSVNYSAPVGGDIGGGIQQRGFNSSWGDRAYNMYLEPDLHNIAHTGSTLTLRFFASGAGWQGGDDESWAVDNLKVTLNGTAAAVPEPTSALLFLPGLAAFGLVRLRRKKQAAPAEPARTG